MAKREGPLFTKLQSGVRLILPGNIHVEKAASMPVAGDSTPARSHIARLLTVHSGFRFATKDDKHCSPIHRKEVVAGIVVFLDPELLGREVEVDWVYTHPETERQSIALIAAD